MVVRHREVELFLRRGVALDLEVHLAELGGCAVCFVPACGRGDPDADDERRDDSGEVANEFHDRDSFKPGDSGGNRGVNLGGWRPVRIDRAGHSQRRTMGRGLVRTDY